MRKKIAVGVGLVTVVLAIGGPPLAVGSVWLFKPPLRKGMTDAEVRRILGSPNYSVGYVISRIGPYHHDERHKHYPEMVDAFGNRRAMVVYFDDEERVTAWEIEPLPRIFPPWLDRAIKAVGW
jgi:hypothetical protein